MAFVIFGNVTTVPHNLAGKFEMLSKRLLPCLDLIFESSSFHNTDQD